MLRSKRILPSALTALVLLVLCASESAAQGTAEWPQWRGPNRDGISKETGLLKQWPENGPPLAWKAAGAGRGYSSMSVSKGKLYTMGLRGDREFVVALDFKTGKEVWATPHGTAFRNDRGDGPRGTPTVDGDRVYALGGNGDLTALDAASGKVVWTMNVLQKFGGSNITWGISESPLIVGEKLLVNAGGPGASIVALNKKDGSLIWKSQSDRAGYSSGIPVVVNGKTQVVFFTSSRGLGLDLETGALLWEYTRAANNVANAATPVARGNRVFITSDYGNGGGLVEIKADAKGVSASEVYFTKEMRNHHSSSILVGEHLYGFSGGILTAMRFDTGDVAWRDRSVGKGSLVFADGMFYALSEDGVVGLFEANPTSYVERGRFRIPQDSLPTWSHPIIAGGHLFLRDQDTIYAYDLRQKK
ncbi:MAG TPA: PQQ-binding-like beta-propeller repeat protein [Pyrinomonadaceae bacterium]|jgi:outer membrane protein assembly factor BamB|nr:PQQ-binding-like beta-propeller repeat protein [Pyrinomonadaceae bacterium]